MANDKLVVILGPTASGKSSLAIKLARKFNGEIISADSRQVYQGMDLGTGKITKSEQRMAKHHLLDIISPKQQFTVAQFKKKAKAAIADIQGRGKLPFLVGGTAFYIYAVIDGLDIPVAKPDRNLRKKLSSKTTEELFRMLKRLDPARARNIDQHNKARLVRAIEINVVTRKNVPQFKFPIFHQSKKNVLILGIKKPLKKLRQLINIRVDQRLKQGMVAEVRKLKAAGVSYQRLESFGLEYRHIAWFLQEKVCREEMVQKLKNAIWRFAKRQLTWFKRDPRIKWISTEARAGTILNRFLRMGSVPNNLSDRTVY